MCAYLVFTSPKERWASARTAWFLYLIKTLSLIVIDIKNAGTIGDLKPGVRGSRSTYDNPWQTSDSARAAASMKGVRRPPEVARER